MEKIDIDTTNLILNDIICHGTPSPLLWKQYLNYIQKKSKLKSYIFRAKERGWTGYAVRAEYEDGTTKTDTDVLRIFTELFFSHMALQPSCYHSKFTNMSRPSDITIGDYWGIDKLMPEFVDDKGVSLVIVNTPKGQAVFEKIKDNFYVEQSNTIDCVKGQLNLKRSTERPSRRDYCWQDYYNNGFGYVAKKYAGYGILGRSKTCIVKLMRRLGLLSVIKKALRR